jgi:hypothetical protein
MTTPNLASIAWLPAALGLTAMPALAFDSGSSGADGTLAPTVNTTIDLPASGVLNYTSINIPAGVRVAFRKNATNTPVVLLVQGNVTINGTIDVSGGRSAHAGTQDDGNVGDDGLPGLGGPGGYDGGAAGPLLSAALNERGSDGIGPGGGKAGQHLQGICVCGGGGGGYNGGGASDAFSRISGGGAYGSALLLPLIGGSGGGGGASYTQYRGSGGGGGGGAILIAASGTVTIGSGGQILANGGDSGNAGSVTGVNPGSTGGGGSGGAIRIVATTITGEGTLQAKGGVAGTNATNGSYRGGNGASGRIRLEAESFQRAALTDPGYSFGAPGALSLAGTPSLRITSVAGQNVPVQPTGRGDVLLPSNVTNPVTVGLEAVGVPAGTLVQVTITPANAASATVDSSPLAGDQTLSTATALLTLPPGPSVILATTTYQVSLALGQSLSRFANNETVTRVRLSAALGGAGSATLITDSGREYELPLAALALAGE